MSSEFIVRLPSGRKSKPVTRSEIQRQFESGAIPVPASVTCQGKRLSVPVEVFVSDGQLLDHLLSGLSDIEPAESLPKFSGASVSTFRPGEDAAAESPLITPKPFKPPVQVRNRSFLLVVVALAAFTGIALVLSWHSRSMVAEAAQQARAAFVAVVNPDPEQEAVRAYLRENLTAKEWEEIRWDALTVGQPMQWDVLWEAVNLARMVPNPSHRPFFALQTMQETANGQPIRFQRVKLRTFGQFGPLGVSEFVFQIDGGKAVPTASELDEAFERSWDALTAAANGQKLVIPPTPAEKQWIENQESMRQFDQILKDEVPWPRAPGANQ